MGIPILPAEEISRRQAQTLHRLALLPIFNQAALKLLTIATDADSARDDFELAFGSDPSLATDLMVVANSPEFGFRAQVNSIPHALSLLGLERARSLALTIAMSFYLRTSTGIDVDAAWKHSMASVALAGHIAETCSLSLPMLNTAALLHDIGRLGFHLSSQEDYSSLAKLEILEIDEALRVERVLFGMNHCEAGAAMSRTWGFPEALERHIRRHHDQVPLEQDPIDYSLQLACRLAEALGYPEFPVPSGASKLGLEEAIPARFRNNSKFTPECLAAVVDAHFAATNGLRVS
jgi:putative nucleotidyltransferase with HDIG domain